MEHIFITVGTTQFNKLIDTVLSDDLLETFRSLGCKKLTIQTGQTKYEQNKDNDNDIIIEMYQFKDSIDNDLKMADLVISHSGAGSILESLRLKKRLLVVVNEDLMDNHQYELAEKMSEEHYLYYCTCDCLNDTLRQKDFTQLQIRNPGNSKLFVNYIDKLMGIEV